MSADGNTGSDRKINPPRYRHENKAKPSDLIRKNSICSECCIPNFMNSFIVLIKGWKVMYLPPGVLNICAWCNPDEQRTNSFISPFMNGAQVGYESHASLPCDRIPAQSLYATRHLTYILCLTIYTHNLRPHTTWQDSEMRCESGTLRLYEHSSVCSGWENGTGRSGGNGPAGGCQGWVGVVRWRKSSFQLIVNEYLCCGWKHAELYVLSYAPWKTRNI